MNIQERAAALLDSKGSISIGLDNYRGKLYFYEQCRVSGNNEELEPLQKHFGGTISSNGVHCRLIWRITADKALDFFEQILPYIEGRKRLVEMVVKVS